MTSVRREAVWKLAPIRILLVDDFCSWRRCVSTILQDCSEIEIVGEAADGLEAVDKAAQLRPDVIMLDIDLPKLDGIEAARRICTLAPDAVILFISGNQCPDVVHAALSISSGTRGYVVKCDAATDLLPALGAVMKNQHFISGRLVRGSGKLLPES